METPEKRQLIESILREHTRVPHKHGDIQIQTIFDRESDRYLVMLTGWEGIRRVHSCLIQVDLIDGKFWVQHDGTEYGVARELLDAGVPRPQIVLGFHPPELQMGEVAVA